MNARAEAYAARRQTPPMTEAEYQALVTELDPTGEYGLRILDRHLQSIDRVKELCKKNPNKPKVRAAILAEYESFRQFIRDVTAEAVAAHNQRKETHGIPHQRD